MCSHDKGDLIPWDDLVPKAVMARLVPAIHVLSSLTPKDVDARRKAGHDELVQP
jgi:hypothetical protein